MNTVINVSFRSEYIAIAEKLFSEALNITALKPARESAIACELELNSQAYSIRDVRNWLSSALACGLIYTGSCVES